MDEELREIENTVKKGFEATKKVIKFLGDFENLTARTLKLPSDIKEKIREKHQKKMADMQYKQFKHEQKEIRLNKAPEQNISNILNNEVTGFNFTGQYTDLCYFHQSESMPISAIANIPDENIKNAVVQTFDKAIANGEFEIKNGYLNITDKGKKIINEPAFIKLSKTDQIQAYNTNLNRQFKVGDNETQMCVELSGNYKNDFTFFNHSDTLDLNQILAHPNKELSAKILANVQQWQKKGAVTVSKNGIATITPNGKKMLKSPEFQSIAKKLSEQSLKAVKATSKQIIVATKKVTEKATKATTKAIKNVILKK